MADFFPQDDLKHVFTKEKISMYAADFKRD